jgi:hypothetical protein
MDKQVIYCTKKGCEKCSLFTDVSAAIITSRRFAARVAARVVSTSEKIAVAAKKNKYDDYDNPNPRT